MARSCGNCRFCVYEEGIKQSFCHGQPPQMTVGPDGSMSSTFVIVAADKPSFWCRLHRYRWWTHKSA